MSHLGRRQWAREMRDDESGAASWVYVLAAVGVLFVLGLIVILVLAFMVPPIIPPDGPEFAVSDENHQCNFDNITFAFKLWNNGDENGIASIRFLARDGNATLVNATKTYGVFANDSRNISETFPLGAGSGLCGPSTQMEVRLE